MADSHQGWKPRHNPYLIAVTVTLATKVPSSSGVKEKVDPSTTVPPGRVYGLPFLVTHQA